MTTSTKGDRGKKTRRPIAQSRQGNRRVMITIVVATVLIAAIAYTNRDSDEPPHRQADKHSRQGAMDAAEHVAISIGSEKMFDAAERADIVQSIAHPDARDRLTKNPAAGYDYLAKKLGLDEQGKPPKGQRLVSETIPLDVEVNRYTPAEATVDVSARGRFGIEGSKDSPIKTSTFTVTVELAWSDADDRWWATDYGQD
ncbi:hypothetical protein [Streptomyces sp. NBC_01304]|uniref:hypothetical protein n=1 Tax=Streptomyces sp. NBC_01304 TaxID=2903818 RepID=UPI002E15ECD9|nr:hypothetical protein OG430_49290 [Streptomyces sp. NBC_01304]